MASLEKILCNMYINKNIYTEHKNYILSLYSQYKHNYENDQENFRMIIKKLQNLKKFSKLSGIVLSGTIKVGETIKFLPNGPVSTVLDFSSGEPAPGEHLTLEINHILKPNFTGMISSSTNVPKIASSLRVKIYWLSSNAPIVGLRYNFIFGCQSTCGTINRIKHHNEYIKQYTCNILLDKYIIYDTVSDNIATGTFVIYSENKNLLLGIGIIEYALSKDANIYHQVIDISKEARASIKFQKPCVLWLTGISGAGKSTIANALEKELYIQGYHTYILDGDNIRYGLNNDLGFSEEDRVENIRRIAEVAHLMVDAGLIIITAFISPFRSDRAMARRLFADGEFIEVYIDTPLKVAEKRDPKGLYAKARRGELKNFTGIDSPYEAPINPEIRIDTTQESIHTAVKKIIDILIARSQLHLKKTMNG